MVFSFLKCYLHIYSPKSYNLLTGRCSARVYERRTL
nr:MAG TPA: hypothetical protein [Caudoviricetes sp.]